MKESLKQVSCDPTCGFLIRSHDVGELKKFVVDHAKKAHNMNITGKDVEEKMKSV